MNRSIEGRIRRLEEAVPHSQEPLFVWQDTPEPTNPTGRSVYRIGWLTEAEARARGLASTR